MKLRSFRVIGLMAVLVLLLGVPLSALQAQDSTVTLSVTIPEFLRPLVTDKLFEEFENSHPGVKVHIVYTGFDTQFPPSPSENLDDYLAKIETLATTADVVLVGQRTATVEATRSGYYLDLTPLTSADPSLNVDDFVPAVWDSFQWDGGVWALPLSTDVITLIYDPDAFDKAGLAYPNQNWTIEDFATAAEALAERDSDGTVTVPGLVTFDNTGLLLRSLLGTGFYDNSVFPQAPAFENPSLDALLTRWAELLADGVVASSFNGDMTSAPMRMMGGFGLQSLATGGEPSGPTTSTSSSGSSDAGSSSGGAVQVLGSPSGTTVSAATLLPGGVAGLDVQGLAVSAGTQYPELAYELAKFMTMSTQFANNPFGVAPARQSLAGVEPAQSDNGGFVFNLRFPPEAQAIINDGLAHGLPASEMRFADYVNAAIDEMNKDGLNAHTALQDMEAAAVANLQTAADKHSTLSIIVTPPPPEVVLQPGEVGLKFGIQSFINPMPNLDKWEQLAADFAASDPQVGKVELDTNIGDVSQFAERDDCFYLPYNGVPGLDPSLVLNLDPFIDADRAIDKSDFVGNTLAQVQLDNKIWAFPLVIMPQILRYQSDLLAKAGVTVPENGWTIDQFVDALHALKTAYPDQKPFEPRDPGGSYLLLLIAAYGGIPLDFRTSPPTVNFTDPAAVDAIRQVLDLAKAEYIDYQELGRTTFQININGETQDLIYTEALNGVGIRFIVGGNDANAYRMTLYPTGSQFSAVSYDIGTAYISANSQNADACYRWISTVAQHADLFSSMPARRSLINDPSLAATLGADVVAAYQQFDALLQNPSTVVFPTPFAGNGGSPSNFIVQFWMNRAFDRYVFDDVDLDAELQDAQTYAQAFLSCVANLPPVDPQSQNRRDYFQQYNNCAVTADPSMATLFPQLSN